jgi:hypothetical protein
VTGVETPPPQQAPASRRCPRCGAALTDEQEWCLHCGAAVGTRVVAAPGWRTPIVIVATLLALAAIAVAVAIVQLADDTGQVAQNPVPTAAAPTPAPTVTPAPTLPEASGQETPTPSATPTPTTTPSTTPTPSGGGVAAWPAGKTGWTVILSSDETKSEAQQKARGFTQDGVAGVGVLDSNGFSSLKAGYWVVFSGQYDSQSAATDALDGLDVKDAYVRHIVPK